MSKRSSPERINERDLPNYLEQLTDDVLAGPLVDVLAALDVLNNDMPNRTVSRQLMRGQDGLFDMLALSETDTARHRLLKGRRKPTLAEWLARLLRTGDRAAFLAFHFLPDVCQAVLEATTGPVARYSTAPMRVFRAYKKAPFYALLDQIYTNQVESLYFAAGRHGDFDQLGMLDVVCRSFGPLRRTMNEASRFAFFAGAYMEASWTTGRLPAQRSEWARVFSGSTSFEAELAVLGKVALDFNDPSIIDDVFANASTEFDRHNPYSNVDVAFFTYAVTTTARGIDRLRRIGGRVPTPLFKHMNRNNALDYADTVHSVFRSNPKLSDMYAMADAPASFETIVLAQTCAESFNDEEDHIRANVWLLAWILASGRPGAFSLWRTWEEEDFDRLIDAVGALPLDDLHVFFNLDSRTPVMYQRVTAPLRAEDVRDLVAFERTYPGVLAVVFNRQVRRGYALTVVCSVAEWQRHVSGIDLDILPLTVLRPILLSLVGKKTFADALPDLAPRLVGRLRAPTDDKEAGDAALIYCTLFMWNPVYFWERLAGTMGGEELMCIGARAVREAFRSTTGEVYLGVIDFCRLCLRLFYRSVPAADSRPILVEYLYELTAFRGVQALFAFEASLREGAWNDDGTINGLIAAFAQLTLTDDTLPAATMPDSLPTIQVDRDDDDSREF